MLMPMPNNAGRALMRRSSSCNTALLCWSSPAPPYCVGHVGTVQPFSAMRSSRTLVSGFLYCARRPPPGISSCGIGVRMLAGQFASSQPRTSWRKVSSDIQSATALKRHRVKAP
jgi:hypothetical protein